MSNPWWTCTHEGAGLLGCPDCDRRLGDNGRAGRRAAREEIERLALADREFFRWTASGPKGCPPYTSHFGTALARLDESFAALSYVEDHLRAEIERLTAELHAAQAVIAEDDETARLFLDGSSLSVARLTTARDARRPHAEAHKARQGGGE